MRADYFCARYSSILSAYGMALADVAVDLSEPFVRPYSTSDKADVEGRFQSLRQKTLDKLVDQGIHRDIVTYDHHLVLQYQGSDTTLMIHQPADNDFAKAFIQEHKREFAFVLEAPILITSVRVRATSKATSADLSETSPYVEELRQYESKSITYPTAKPFGSNSVYFAELGKFSETPLYRLGELSPGMLILGPSIILDNTQTIVVHPQNSARILKSHVIIDVGLGPKKNVDVTSVDPIQLSIFSHRFMGIAEQMCRSLQKTAVSVAIKERLE